MKSYYLKTILSLFFIFCLATSFAQQKQKNQLTPQWVCPHLDLHSAQKSVYISVVNFSMQSVKVVILFYDYAGNVVKKDTTKLDAKQSFKAGFFYNKYLPDNFVGHIEIQSTSSAVYPSAYYTQTAENDFINVHLDWYRVN